MSSIPPSGLHNMQHELPSAKSSYLSSKLKGVAAIGLIALSTAALGLAIWGASLSLPRLFHYAFNCVTPQGVALMFLFACFVTVMEGMVTCIVLFPAMLGMALLKEANSELGLEYRNSYKQQRLDALQKEADFDNL